MSPQPDTVGPVSAEVIGRWLARRIADTSGQDAARIDVDAPFERFGLTSVEAVSLSGELEDWLGLQLPPSVLFDHPSIARLSDLLAREGVRTDRDQAGASPVAPSPPGPSIDPTAEPTGSAFGQGWADIRSQNAWPTGGLEPAS